MATLQSLIIDHITFIVVRPETDLQLYGLVFCNIFFSSLVRHQGAVLCVVYSLGGFLGPTSPLLLSSSPSCRLNSPLRLRSG